MDFDLDDLLSSDAANNAKAGAKFQPKAKPKPKPKPKPKTQPDANSGPTPSKQFAEAVSNAADVFLSRTEEELPGNDVNQISANIHDNPQSSSKKSQEEDCTQNAESSVTAESLNNLLPVSATETVTSPPSVETPTEHVHIDGNLERGPPDPNLINNIDTCTNLDSFTQLDPLTEGEAIIYNDNVDFQIRNFPSGSKDTENWESFDILSPSKTCSGPKVCKFKPKPKAQTRRVQQTADLPVLDSVPVQYEENNHSVPSQNNFMENEVFPSFTQDESPGLSSIRVTDSVPTETISDIHVNEDPIDLVENSQVDSEHQSGVSSERLKVPNKRLQLIDESDDEGINDVHRNEDNNNVGNHGPENEIKSGRKGRKSKKPVSNKEKPVRKRKKVSEVPGESTKAPKKKFSHSTRRNKRQVDPKYLIMPEEELELQMHDVPMKELIRLAEHRERIAKKEASTSATHVSNQSSSFSNQKNEGEAIAQGKHDDDEPEAENATFYNYRTYTKITPRMKWSKQDTELFFEAVQQFGTDLSMIKEFFPGRTREQIKSKYKKEERQHPSRLNDAITTRAKGHSHFEVVIERLKQAQAENSENDDPIDLMGEDEEGLPTHDNNEEAADATKPVQSEKEFSQDTPAAAAGSPTKSQDSEDDMFRWDQYKSDI
uniref:uncharacterized protein LOC122596221 n=1 Tax=Erigeron canadensis TaxID=72917 RepID=UPI001CB9D6B6|nr:uncharacterized protein LOC122596221 [Erigeron canadensis]